MASNTKKVEASKKFLFRLKTTNPELYEKLLQQASWLIASGHQNKKPKEIQRNLKIKLANEPSFDPRYDADTYGIKAAIDALEPDRKMASKSKRLYTGALDAIFKDTYKESIEINPLDIFIEKILDEELNLESTDFYQKKFYDDIKNMSIQNLIKIRNANEHNPELVDKIQDLIDQKTLIKK